MKSVAPGPPLPIFHPRFTKTLRYRSLYCDKITLKSLVRLQDSRLGVWRRKDDEMNLLHRAMLSQQQRHQSRHILCPACGLPALFARHGHRENGQGGGIEWWTCGNCGVATELSDLWPISPVARALERYSEGELPILVLSEDKSRSWSAAEVI